ncbi:flavodoxin FldA [Prevotella sp. A2931]|uniref:Flavodoxin n=1 Tax=Prevotella illustrans TaxID=2800387 RepID=A0ABS3M629_9BACT|nr:MULTISPECIES: flavodoxin FldA [Prevotella]MBO1363623.1 flavodoxin FldA [Prevotella illustrans]PTL27208.1 flavodoxin [Prevotella sp. oral taxon 820]
MNKTCIIYGSSTGTCEELASRIAGKLGVDSSDILEAASISSEQLDGYQNLILGTSTWGAGELQDDWYDGVAVIKKTNLNGKTVAIFGCGDSESYSDTFCGGMAELYNAAKEAGANIIGEVSTEGYTFDDSEAIVDGKFVGLALDEVNEDNKTDERIAAWVGEIAPKL